MLYLCSCALVSHLEFPISFNSKAQVELSGWWIRQSWSPFQRQCIAHIADHLPSIKELVEVMGDDVLDHFCRHGFLDEDTVARFEEVEGCLALGLDDDEPENDEVDALGSGDEAEDDEEEAEDGNEDDAQGDEDHDDGHDEEEQE